MPKAKKAPDLIDKISVGSLFLDSGAFSLFAERVKKNKKAGPLDFSWFDTRFNKDTEFRQYVDEYAAFVKENLDVLDYYANVDVIFSPQKSWETLKYLETQHGLHPVPVLHPGESLKWLEKHLEAGYEFLGLGGMGHRIPEKDYLHWADLVFRRLCPGPTYLPQVRTHGFAMTSYQLLLRFPWFSVDSATWTKVGAFGNILVPHRRGNPKVFDFSDDPYMIAVSGDSKETGKSKHYKTLTPNQRETLDAWLKEIGIPLGKQGPDGEVLEDGVVTRHSERKAANLLFFERMRQSLPAYPWPYKPKMQRGSFNWKLGT